MIFKFGCRIQNKMLVVFRVMSAQVGYAPLTKIGMDILYFVGVRHLTQNQS